MAITWTRDDEYLNWEEGRGSRKKRPELRQFRGTVMGAGSE
jgi:hypothetical protein